MSTDYSSYLTTTTRYTSAKRIIYQTKLLEKAAARLVLEKFGAKQSVQKGEGGSMRFNKLLRLARTTTADTEGYAYGIADVSYLQSNYKDVTPTRWGASFGFTDDVTIETFISDENNQNEIADQFARTHEYQLKKVIGQGGLRHRLDGDANYEVSGTCDAGSSATALVDNALTQADDYWNGGYVTITNPEGPAYDETSAVSDFATSGDTATVAFTNALTTASKYHMAVGTGVVATDILTSSAILDVCAMHSLLRTELFNGNTLRMVIDPEIERDFWKDTTYLDAKYDNSGVYANYKIIRFLGNEMLVADSVFREDVNGTENTAGVVRVVPVFGAKAYSIIRWGMGAGSFGVKWEYKDKADSGDVRNNVKVISWKSKYAASVLRATSIVNLMCGATSMNLLV